MLGSERLHPLMYFGKCSMKNCMSERLMSKNNNEFQKKKIKEQSFKYNENNRKKNINLKRTN